MFVSRSVLLAFASAALAFGHTQMASADSNGGGGGGIECPQWSTPVCRHWALGPPASCTEWACAATKGTDPKTVQGTLGGGGKKPKFPIVKGAGSGLKLQSTSTVSGGQPVLRKKDCFGPKKCF